MSLGRDALTTLGSRFAAVGLALGQSILLARYLQPEGRGQYAMLLLIPQLIAFLAPLGLEWSSVYFLRENKLPRDRIVRSGFGLSLLLAAAGFGIALVLELTLYERLLAGLATAAVVLATLITPVRVVDRLFRGVLRGSDRIPAINLIDVIRPSMTVIGVIVMIVMFQAGIYGLVLVVLVVEAFLMLVTGYLAFRGLRPIPRFERAVLGPLLSYGLRIYAYSILLFLTFRIDMALVRHYLDYREVGYYVTAVAVAETIWNVPNALGFVLFPRVAGADRERQNRVTSAISRITVVVIGVACLCAAGLSYPVIRLLYGASYTPAALPLVLLLPGIFAMSLQSVLGADISGRGYPGRITFAALLGLTLNVLLNWWWIPKWGVRGAAVASSISYALIAFVVLLSFTRLSGCSLRQTLLLRREDLEEVGVRIRRMRRGGA